MGIRKEHKIIISRHRIIIEIAQRDHRLHPLEFHHNRTGIGTP